MKNYTFPRIKRICAERGMILKDINLGYKGTRYKNQEYALVDANTNKVIASGYTANQLRQLFSDQDIPLLDAASDIKQPEPFKLFDTTYSSLRDCAKAFNIQPIRIKEGIAKGKTNEQAVAFAIVQYAKQEADNYICPNIRLWSYHHTKNKSVYYEYMDLSTGIIDIASDVVLIKMYLDYM